jgi:hypothetical protein
MKIGIAVVLVAAAAGARFQMPTFTIERSVEAGAAFEGKKGAVFFGEMSRGQFGFYLNGPMPEGEWSVAVDTDDALERLTFKKVETSFWGRARDKEERVEAYCARRYGEVKSVSGLGKVRPKLCFLDTDGDNSFDRVAEGYARVIVDLPESDYGLELIGHDVPFGVETLSEDHKPITPAAYALRRAHPEDGREGVIELRYEGVQGGMMKIVVSGGMAGATKPLYETSIEVPRPKEGPVEVVIAHPILGSPGFRRSLGHDWPPLPPAPEGKPQPAREPPTAVPTMTLSITSAVANSIRGTVVKPFPDWRWTQHVCKTYDVRTKTLIVQTSKPPCETMTFRDGRTVHTLGRH